MMKTRILAIFTASAMFLALCSCGGTSETVSSNASASDVSSSQELSEVTAEELEQIKQAYTDCAAAGICDQSYKSTVTRESNGTKNSKTEKTDSLSRVTGDSTEMYSQSIYSDYGIDTRKIYYYTDTAGYYIFEQGNTKYGYTWTMPEEGITPDEETLKFPLEDISAATAVRNADGGITLSYSGDDEGAFETLSHLLTAGSYFDQNKEGYDTYNVSLTDKTAELSVTVDRDMRVTALYLKLTFTEGWQEDDGSVRQDKVTVETDLTVNAYGEGADVTVPVPEDLDICVNIDPSESE